jgi:O-antigen/teichoic acid export membrane protein
MPDPSSFQQARATIGQHLPTFGTILFTSGARAYSALTTLIGLVLTVRWLGAEDRGIVVVIVAWVTTLANLTSLSLWQVAVHRAAKNRGKRWLGPMLGALLIFCCAATAIAWVVAALLYVCAGRELFRQIPVAALVLGFAALPFVIWELYSNSLLSIVDRLKVLNLNQVAARTVGIFVIVVTIKLFGLGIYGFLASYLCTELMIAIVAGRVLLREASGGLLSGIRQIPSLLRDGLKMHFQIVGSLLFGSVDILLVHYFRGASAAAIYQFASALFVAILLIPQSAVLALQAKVARKPVEALWSEQRLVLAAVTGTMTLIAAAGWLLAPWITVTLATGEFESAGTVLRIFLLAIPPAAVVWIMSLQWLARGHFLGLGLLYFLMGVVSCGLNLLLIPRYGAQGAAATVVVIWYAIPLLPSILMAVRAEREARAGKLPSSQSALEANYAPEPPAFP